jgi:hypothetical protein
VPIETVTEFKYLGWIISADNWDDAAISLILKKALMAWFYKFHVLSHNTADSCVMGCYYLAVVQAKLLFGSETWVLSPCLTWWLESFHNRCAPAIALCPIQCALGNTLLQMKYLLLVLHLWSLHTLQDSKQGSLITMPMLRASCIINVLPPLQSGVELFAKCGGPRIPTPLRCIQVKSVAR